MKLYLKSKKEVFLQYFDVGHMKRVWLRLFWEVDTTTVRLILATSSLFCAIALLFSADELPTMPSFKHLLPLAGPEVWAAMYFTHYLGAFWRFFDPTPRVTWALAINILGLALWMCPTFSAIYEFGTLSPIAAIGLVVCIFGAWALYRTGLGKEIVTP